MSRLPDSRAFVSQVSLYLSRQSVNVDVNGPVVTYSDHFTSAAPNYTVDAAWLQRVSDVVDMATARGLYVLTNVHHGKTTQYVPTFV